MEISKSSGSTSDISSNSSWTFLDESRGLQNIENEGNLELSHTSPPALAKTEQNDPNKAEISPDTDISSTSIIEKPDDKKPSDSFLSFDEYMQERLIVCEEEARHTTFSSKSIADMRRREAETVHILSMTCSLLVLTGLSILCLLFPTRPEATVIHAIENSFAKDVNLDSYDYNQTISTINATSNLVNLVAESKLLDKVKDDLATRYTNAGPPTWEEHSRCTEDDSICVETENNPLKFSENHEESVSNDNEDGLHLANKEGDTPVTDDTKTDLMFDKESKNGKDEAEPTFPTTQSGARSRLSTLKQFLSRTSILTIISCVMHNICVFKLVQHLCKNDETKKESKPSEETVKAVEQNAELKEENKISKPVTSKKRIRVTKLTKKLSPKDHASLHLNLEKGNTLVPSLNTTDGLGFNFTTSNGLCPVKKKLIEEISSEEYGVIANQIKNDTYKLSSDKIDDHKLKSQIFTEENKKQIKLLKNRLHQEITQVKEEEMENTTRSKRINAIKANFIRRLKEHREKYLRELQQLREERQTILKELCSHKTTQIIESKDAAVGNYVVPLTGLCAFEERVKMLQEKQTMGRPIVKKSYPAIHTFTSEPQNKLCPYQSSPCFKVEKLKLEKYIPFHKNLTDNEHSKQEHPNYTSEYSCEDSREEIRDERRKLREIRKKYLKKQTQILDEYSKLMSDEVQRIGRAGEKLVDPCISLLDDIILEAVEMVHKRSNAVVDPTQTLAVEKRLVDQWDESRQKKIAKELEKIYKSVKSKDSLHDVIARSTEATKSLIKKMDIYTALFEKKGKSIKMSESRKVKPTSESVVSIKQNITKQDPYKCYIEKILKRHN